MSLKGSGVGTGGAGRGRAGLWGRQPRTRLRPREPRRVPVGGGCLHPPRARLGEDPPGVRFVGHTSSDGFRVPFPDPPPWADPEAAASDLLSQSMSRSLSVFTSGGRVTGAGCPAEHGRCLTFPRPPWSTGSPGLTSKGQFRVSVPRAGPSCPGVPSSSRVCAEPYYLTVQLTGTLC